MTLASALHRLADYCVHSCGVPKRIMCRVSQQSQNSIGFAPRFAHYRRFNRGCTFFKYYITYCITPFLRQFARGEASVNGLLQSVGSSQCLILQFVTTPDPGPDQGHMFVQWYIKLHYTVPSSISETCFLSKWSSKVPWVLILSGSAICHHAWPHDESDNHLQGHDTRHTTHQHHVLP